MKLEVTFRLAFGTRKDDAAEVHVGFCPLLNLYSQGASGDEAEAAVVDAAKLFIATCYSRDTLHRILRGHGMVSAEPSAERSEDHQFIEVKELQDYDRQFEREVPINLLAAAGLDLSACHL